MEPSREAATTAQTAQPGLEYSAAQVRQIVSTMRPTPQQVLQIQNALGLSAAEAAALASGASGVRLTPQQHEQLVALAARASADDAARDDGSGGCGDVCGSCGTPTPSPTTSPSVTTPAASPHADEVTVDTVGDTLHTASVGGGTITLRHNVQYTPTAGGSQRTDGFSLGYNGPNAENTRVLQFIWREIIGIHSDGSAHPLTSTITTSAANSYQLTGGGTETANGTPAKANYNTDSNSSSNPFYETGFFDNRSADATTIYDMPGAQTTYINQAFSNGAARVVSRAHFIQFLIQNDAVVYKAGINIIWTVASSGATPVQSETVGDCGTASSLPTVLRERLHEQYPAFNYLR